MLHCLAGQSFESNAAVRVSKQRPLSEVRVALNYWSLENLRLLFDVGTTLDATMNYGLTDLPDSSNKEREINGLQALLKPVSASLECFGFREFSRIRQQAALTRTPETLRSMYAMTRKRAYKTPLSWSAFEAKMQPRSLASLFACPVIRFPEVILRLAFRSL